MASEPSRAGGSSCYNWLHEQPLPSCQRAQPVPIAIACSSTPTTPAEGGNSGGHGAKGEGLQGLTAQTPAHLMDRSVKGKWQHRLNNAPAVKPHPKRRPDTSNPMPFFLHRTCHAASSRRRLGCQARSEPFVLGGRVSSWSGDRETHASTHRNTTAMLPFVRHAVFIPNLTLPCRVAALTPAINPRDCRYGAEK